MTYRQREIKTNLDVDRAGFVCGDELVGSAFRDLRANGGNHNFASMATVAGYRHAGKVNPLGRLLAAEIEARMVECDCLNEKRNGRLKSPVGFVPVEDELNGGTTVVWTCQHRKTQLVEPRDLIKILRAGFLCGGAGSCDSVPYNTSAKHAMFVFPQTAVLAGRLHGLFEWWGAHHPRFNIHDRPTCDLCDTVMWPVPGDSWTMDPAALDYLQGRADPTASQHFAFVCPWCHSTGHARYSLDQKFDRFRAHTFAWDREERRPHEGESVYALDMDQPPRSGQDSRSCLFANIGKVKYWYPVHDKMAFVGHQNDLSSPVRQAHTVLYSVLIERHPMYVPDDTCRFLYDGLLHLRVARDARRGYFVALESESARSVQRQTVRDIGIYSDPNFAAKLWPRRIVLPDVGETSDQFLPFV